MSHMEKHKREMEATYEGVGFDKRIIRLRRKVNNEMAIGHCISSS